MKKSYKIIYADPAWLYGDKQNMKNNKRGASFKYNCSTIEDMGKIIEQFTISEDSVCLMWCTYPQLEAGVRLMKLWKFNYKTVAFTWVKKNKKADSFFWGLGSYTRSNPEIVLLGTRGKGVKRISNSIQNLQIHRLKGHSEKPVEIREEIIKLFGDLPRIELFARHKFEGWDVWGEEAPTETQKILR